MTIVYDERLVPNIQQLEDAASSDPAKLRDLYTYYRAKVAKEVRELDQHRETGSVCDSVIDRFSYHTEQLSRVVGSLSRASAGKVVLALKPQTLERDTRVQSR
jgi:hypothetical protein